MLSLQLICCTAPGRWCFILITKHGFPLIPVWVPPHYHSLKPLLQQSVKPCCCTCGCQYCRSPASCPALPTPTLQAATAADGSTPAILAAALHTSTTAAYTNALQRVLSTSGLDVGWSVTEVQTQLEGFYQELSNVAALPCWNADAAVKGVMARLAEREEGLRLARAPKGGLRTALVQAALLQVIEER